MVTIRLVGYLKKVGGFKEKVFELNKPQPISSLVDFPELKERIIVLVNEKGASLDTEIQNDDSVKILPVTGGG